MDNNMSSDGSYTPPPPPGSTPPPGGGASYNPPPPPAGGSGSYTPPPPPPMGSTPPPAGSSGDLIYPPNPARDPVIILVLNLVLVCVGYFVMGQWQKGIATIVVALVLGVPTCGLGIGLVAVGATIDGFLQAQQLQAGHPIGQWTFLKDHK
ncbi:MAG TPA: hypothetical protein VNM92_17435 [Thermoanaerobaculia bacterium]|nr:hypothetical protein [Thermoanaerobaculia bacterium]